MRTFSAGTCDSANASTLARPGERRLRAGVAPAAAVAVGHDLELVDGGAETLVVGRLLRVPAARLGVLGEDGDREQAVLVVERVGELLDELREAVAVVGRDELPVEVEAVEALVDDEVDELLDVVGARDSSVSRMRAAMSPSKSPPGLRFTTVAKAWMPRARVCAHEVEVLVLG